MPCFPAIRKTDAVAAAVEMRQVHDHDRVVTLAVDPALKGQHAVVVVDMRHPETVAA